MTHAQHLMRTKYGGRTMLSNALTKDESWFTIQTGTTSSSAVLSSEKKSWRELIKSRLNKLVELPSNWNSYGGSSISEEKANIAYSLLDELLRDSTPLPQIVPTPNGSIQIEWHINNIDLEIEIISAIEFDVYYGDLTGNTTPWEDRIGLDLNHLSNAVKELTNRS